MGMTSTKTENTNLLKDAVVAATNEAIEEKECITELRKIKSTPVKIVGISGSLRKASFHSGLLRYLASQKLEGIDFEIVPIGDLPLFNQDLEDTKDETKQPKAVQAFKAKIRSADAFVITCPEYNFGITAPLKNALDWASRGQDSNLWQGKVAALAGAGGSGAQKAQIQLRGIAVFLELQIMDRPFMNINAFQPEDDGKNVFDYQTGDLLSKKWKGRMVEQVNLLRDVTKKNKLGQKAFEMLKRCK